MNCGWDQGWKNKHEVRGQQEAKPGEGSHKP